MEILNAEECDIYINIHSREKCKVVEIFASQPSKVSRI